MALPLRAGSVAAQTAALGQLSGSERHSAVLSLQRIQGGRHVQRVIAAASTVQREAVPGTVHPPLAPDDPEKLLKDQAERKVEIRSVAQVLSEVFLGLGPPPRRPRNVVIKTPGR